MNAMFDSGLIARTGWRPYRARRSGGCWDLSQCLCDLAQVLSERQTPNAEHRTLRRPPDQTRNAEFRPPSRGMRLLFASHAVLDNLQIMRSFDNPALGTPQVHLMSNGRYQVVITNAGGGYSRWGDLAITRWREDATCDHWGTFIYLRDTATGEFWSSAYQPTLRPSERYEVTFTDALAEFRQQLSDLEVCLQICVSAEDDVEFRRVTLGNRASRTRSIELT